MISSFSLIITVLFSAAIIVFSPLLIIPVTCSSSLDKYVSYYEVFEQTVPNNEQRNRREAETKTMNTIIHHPITIFNKSLILVLYKDDNTILDVRHVLDVANVSSNHHSNNFDYLVKGYVMNTDESISSSQVYGSLIDGRYQGVISYEGEYYFVEDAAKFKIPGINRRSSIAYRSSDIRNAEIAKLSAGLMLSQNYNISQFIKRVTRAAPPNAASSAAAPKVCGLYIQVDYLLYQEYLKDAQFNHDTAVKQIMAMVHYLVKTVNNIFSTTDFVKKDGKTAGSSAFSKLQISIIRTKIYTTAGEFAARLGVSLSELNQSMDAVSFLNMVSGVNYELFCASYTFTYRYFDGVLGLAWVFSVTPPNLISAGACAKYVRTSSNLRPYMRSQNSGIVTFVNYGQRISQAVAAVTFAHELGHTFGAEHDNKEGNDPACSPDGHHGNYIMFASATSGEKPNNIRFSNCSRHTIANSLSLIINNPTSAGCLKDVAHFCGNAVVDPGEECDCGFKEDCGADANCCGPADDAKPEARCRLRITRTTGLKVKCSGSNGACCDLSTCNFIPKSKNYFCRQADECKQAAFCNGSSAICPTGRPEPDGKICNNKIQICKAGECTGSVCEIIPSNAGGNFTSCQVERPSGPNVKRYNRSELCFLACRSPADGQCFNSAHLDAANFSNDFRSFLFNISNGTPIQLKAGSPCDNDRGYCDVLQRCRPINADEAPLARLATLLFSPKTALTIRTWVELHWWAVTFIGVAIIALSIGFIKCCAVHTKSDNRTLPPARSFGDTLRRVRYLGRERRENNNNNSLTNIPTSNTGQALSELTRFLANNTVPDEDEAPTVSIRSSSPERNSPPVQERGSSMNRRGRGHVRSTRTRIVHSEYNHIPPPAYRLSAVASSYRTRPQTITESPNY